MSLGHGSNIVRKNLQIHVDFANRKCYSESSNTFNNLASNSIGYIKNNVNYNNDFKGILRTNGGGDPNTANVVGDRIDIDTTEGGIDRFKIDTNFTFSFWVRWISGSGKIFSTGSAGDSNTDNCIWQFWASNSRWFWWNNSGSSTNNLEVGYTQLTSNEWCMMSYVYTYNENGNNIIRVYKNNEMIATNSRSNSIHEARDRTTENSLQYTLGGGYNSSCRNQNSINDFGTFYCYNRALTATEIRQNFEALRGRYGI
jgi:hypothetical protein